MSGRLPRAVAVVGPTAAGKSRLGVELAERLGLPILCCDSVQVFRRLDIGSAKPGPEERARVPHRLLDLVDPDGEFSAGDYARAAHAELSAGPGVIVGGTGFYLRAALLTNSGALAQDLPRDDPRRAAFTDTWESRERESPGAAHRELGRVDPETAAAIHPRNVVRAVRALWLCSLHGAPVSEIRRCDPQQRRLELAMIVLDPGPEAVHAAIERRCARMVADGWVAEVEALVADGYDARHRAMRSLGYRQMVDHVRGRCTLARAVADTVAATRRYARRQRSYIRTQLPADVVIAIADPEDCPWRQIEDFLAEGGR